MHRNPYKRRFTDKYFGGHVSFSLFGRDVTIHGWNAMHVAINIWTKRWGYVCFHPTIRCFGVWWRWYFYCSPNGTPNSATYAIGPGVRRREDGRGYVDNYNR
jgi:hypothetical protein